MEIKHTIIRAETKRNEQKKEKRNQAFNVYTDTAPCLRLAFFVPL